MNYEHYFKPQKKLIEFTRHASPEQRAYRDGDRKITS